jgi:hypothetical protein
VPGPAPCEITVTLVPPDRWRRAKTVKAAEKYCAEGATTRVADSMAIDTRGAVFQDRIYIAWTGNRDGAARILFTLSRDRGATWTRPRQVDDLPASVARGLKHKPDNFMAQLAVNSQGVVGLSWHDRRESPDNIGYHVRFRASLDGGETWLPSVRVSEQPARYGAGERPLVSAWAGPGTEAGDPVSVGIRGRGEFHAGDTGGIDADANGVFRVLWVDNRSGVDQLYTAPVTVIGKAVKYGNPELGELEDVSGKVVVELSDVAFDASSRTVTVEVLVRNPTKIPLSGPLIARIVSLESDFGVPVLLGEGPSKGVGALVDFTPTLQSDSVGPNQASGRKTLRFRLDDFQAPHGQSPDEALRSKYVTFDLQVLARPAKEEKK